MIRIKSRSTMAIITIIIITITIIIIAVVIMLIFRPARWRRGEYAP